MKTRIQKKQPSTLVIGKLYEHWEWNGAEDKWNVMVVRLVSYGNCPDIVRVSLPDGKPSQCPRSELYIKENAA